MSSVITRSMSLWTRGLQLTPATAIFLNKNLIANAWVGSYRINNPSEYIDTFPKPKRWPRYNEIIKPPQLDAKEEKRPATYYHYRENIKYSPKKMWYVTKFVLGQNVDEAVKQLRFMPHKGAQVCADVLEEAQEKAVRDHGFEFKSNMWIEDCKCVKGLVIKGTRRHAKCRFGVVHYFYCHLLVKLTEGEPPKHFFQPRKDGNDHLKEFFDNLRNRKIHQGL